MEGGAKVLDRRHDDLDSPDVVGCFLNAAAAEQARFLAALDDARRNLAGAPTDVGQLVASHIRLARHLLDAQRAIVRLRADVHVEITARGGNALPPPTGPLRAGPPVPVRVSPDEASVGVDVLVRRVDSMFEPAGVRAERELLSLLDVWWEREQHAATVALAGPQRRVATARHPGFLPSEPDLEHLVDAVLEASDPQAPAEAPRPRSGGWAANAGHDDSFDRFWRGGASLARGSVIERAALRAVPPMVCAMALALRLLLVG